MGAHTHVCDLHVEAIQQPWMSSSGTSMSFELECTNYFSSQEAPKSSCLYVLSAGITNMSRFTMSSECKTTVGVLAVQVHS